MDSLAKKYEGQIDFYVMYTREAHPGENVGAHQSLVEKKKQAKKLFTEDGLKRNILIDDLNGTMHMNFGGFPNSVMVIGKDGVLAVRMEWNDPGHVESHLDKILAANGLGAEVAPVQIDYNLTRDIPKVTLKVHSRAGLAAHGDFFVSLPAMMIDRIKLLGWANALPTPHKAISAKIHSS